MAAGNQNQTLFVADWQANEVYTYTSAGAQSAFATVSSPIGLALDASGNVYVGSDDSGEEIYEYSSAGNRIKTIATGAQVDALAVSASGNLFEADETGSIFEYLPGGSVMTYATNLPGDGYFGMVFDNAGDLFVTYQGNNGNSGGIEKIAANGSASTFATFGYVPTGLAYDASSNYLYMAEVNDIDTSYGAVYQLSTTDSTPGTPTSDMLFASGLHDPSGIAIITPEPASFGLLLIGLGMGALGLRRRS